MQNCEICNSFHDGTYGSGRFCGLKCSKTFSSTCKKSSKNENISNSLKGRLRTRTLLVKNCLKCSNEFSTVKTSKKYCSHHCAVLASNSNDAVKEKLRIARIREIEKGNVGYGIKTEYRGIRCDSALEYAFLKKYFQDNPESKIERFRGHIVTSSGRKYQPDFIIDDKIIVEVKYTTPYVGEKLSSKWKTYLSTQEEKLAALKEMSSEGFSYLWITEKDVGVPFYRNCLKEIRSTAIIEPCQLTIISA